MFLYPLRGQVQVGEIKTDVGLVTRGGLGPDILYDTELCPDPRLVQLSGVCSVITTHISPLTLASGQIWPALGALTIQHTDHRDTNEPLVYITIHSIKYTSTTSNIS